MTIDHSYPDDDDLRYEINNDATKFMEEVIMDKKVQPITTVEPFNEISDSFANRIALAYNSD